MGFLLDTNVISETMNPRPDDRVVAFLVGEAELWTSALVLHELEYGLAIRGSGRRTDELRVALASFRDRFAHRILPVGEAAGVEAAYLRARAKRAGRVLHIADALIAGTAQTHRLTVATRNEKDFAGLGIPVFNPWTLPGVAT